MSLSPDTTTSGKSRILAFFAAESPAFAALLVSAFCAGFSLPLSRAALVVALILAIRDSRAKRLRFFLPPVAWAWLAFLAVAVITSVFVAATNTDPLTIPHKGVKKLTKLIWYMSIPLTATLVDSRRRFVALVSAFVYGTTLEALGVLCLNVPGAWLQCVYPFPGESAYGAAAKLADTIASLGLAERVRDWIAEPWRARTFNQALAKLAGMATAQRLMVGFIAALALLLNSPKSPNAPHRRRYAALSALLLAAFLLALKRGPWISAALVCAPVLIYAFGIRRAALALAVILTVLLSIPAARERLSELPDELTYDKGGRALMWGHIVPSFRRDHPWGVGFRGITNDAMRRYTRRVEQRQNHVHSNPLQILVELGWQGLALYLVWMSLGVYAAARLARDRELMPGEPLLRAAPLLALSTLLLTGIVEYNFADGELVLVYGLLFGLAAARMTANAE